jgi:acetylornithine deacetylase/succinyl-diaminopimelate desuccinylase-like protein
VSPFATARTSLSPRQASWAEAACAAVSIERLRELAVALTSVPSPTGEEGPLAELIAAELSAGGVRGQVDPLDGTSANAWGKRAGTGTGASLLLYAPIDTLTVGTDDEDVPWIGEEVRPDERALGRVDGDLVTGLGASNPKGHAACVIAALEAIAAADVPLTGDLLAGFGAGGMPTNARPGRRAGHGAGCRHLLERLGREVPVDQAVIAKPGWTVSWEEVGLAWVEVTARGTHTYVGSRHRLPFRDAIVDAATLVSGVESWLPEYTARHTTGTVAPQGIVAAIEGGWWRMAAVTPAACRFLVDLRTGPEQTATSAAAELDAEVRRLAGQHGIDASTRLVLDIPGTATRPDAFVVEAAVEAWEHLEGRTHEVVLANSGATDANILRGGGIPTARIGMPKVPGITDFQLGMNTVDVREMERLTHLLVRTAVNVCTRPRAEVLG